MLHWHPLPSEDIDQATIVDMRKLQHRTDFAVVCSRCSQYDSEVGDASTVAEDVTHWVSLAASSVLKSNSA